ncbi:MAG TPA: iron ABC transporter permease [Burkholderiales bacterium]
MAVGSRTSELGARRARAKISRATLALALGVIALVAMMAIALSAGQYPITIGDLTALLWARASGEAPVGVSPMVETIVLDVRAPRVLAALLVGAALAGSGAAYQTLFRNPLVSPDILGVSAGAALGAVLAIFLSLGIWAIQGFAFTFGLLAVAAAYAIAASLRRHDPVLVLVLAGVVLGSLLGACVALIKYLADPYNQLPAITYWLLGSLAAATPGDVRASAVPVLVGLAALWLVRWRVNVLSLGDEEAAALGVAAGRVRALVIAAATLVTAAVVAISGIIGWIGLVVPHMARMLVGPDFRLLLPVSLLFGATFLLGVDTLARSAARIEIPLGVLTAFVGTPVFVWLLATARRHWQ